ncbi:PDZ domain-containing protein [Desulfovibrio sp. OttesenSCG-928-C14]|nr:PDZ domain-containing protein [Desulfovibrio sp. OttesenSCG-928-C14]
MRKCVPILGFLASCVGALLLAALPVWASPPGRADDDILRLIVAHALTPPGVKEQMVYLREAPFPERTRGFLRRFDQYAAYLTATEYAAILEAQQMPSAGVGMDIVHDRQRNIVCIPNAGSEATRKGLRYGDILYAVDGTPVADMDLDAVGMLIRGKEGTAVALYVIGPRGDGREIPLVREVFRAPSVAWDAPVRNVPVLRVYRFGPGTARDLREALAESPPAKAVVLDLRGNTGGDMRAGVEAARLFLPGGAVLVRTRTRSGESVMKTETPGPYADIRVCIWQDELTASAAEIVIAALRHAGRAQTIGRPTAGKAMAQQVFKLPDGGLLKLTTEAFLLPDGNGTWQGAGLFPDRDTGRNTAGRERYESLTPLPE